MRILVKKHHPINLANLINGFPDNSGDNVLQAVSNLHFLGYISVYDSLRHYISLSKDRRKEVLQIVNPNLNKDPQKTERYSSNEKIVNSKVVKNADEIKKNMTIKPRPGAITRTFALAIVLIGSVIVTGASLLVFISTVNNQESGSPLFYHQAAFSHTTSKFQSLDTSTSAEGAGANLFVVATTIDHGGPLIDNLFVINYSDNTLHRIIVDVGPENVSDASTTIYLRHAFVVLNI
ncbi:MAG TPA: hypothetical protein VFI73_01870 [Candidatus Nitrosopolaris sp.]|nr:hypothetical protein [Candidatus Nitrosopolaris sp.]